MSDIFLIHFNFFHSFKILKFSVGLKRDEERFFGFVSSLYGKL